MQIPNFGFKMLITEAVVATDLKLAMNILTSFSYDFPAPPTSCMGVASARITRGSKSPVLYLTLAAHRSR